MISVNGERLLARINELGAIGKDAEGRRTRLAASDTEKQGRDLVSKWMKEAGLEVVVDRIGNISVSGRLLKIKIRRPYDRFPY